MVRGAGRKRNGRLLGTHCVQLLYMWRLIEPQCWVLFFHLFYHLTKWNFRRVQWHSQCHIASKWQSRESNSSLFNIMSGTFLYAASSVVGREISNPLITHENGPSSCFIGASYPESSPNFQGTLDKNTSTRALPPRGSVFMVLGWGLRIGTLQSPGNFCHVA